MSVDALDLEAEIAGAIGAAVSLAQAAPPLHGTRQWHFEIGAGGVDLRADPFGCLSDRELTIACGTALFDLRVALEHTGLDIALSARPDPGDRRLIARIHILGVGEPPADDLLASIACRHTDRHRFQGRPVTPQTISALRAAATAEGSSLHVFHWPDELRRRLAVEHPPLLAVLATPGDGPMAWLAAGQALERVVLTAVREGLQASVIDQPSEVRELRDRLAALLDPPGIAQAVLRLGYPAHPISVES
jgi:hypothetical protein